MSYECLPLDPAAQVRFPPRAVGIFLHPVTHRFWYFWAVLYVLDSPNFTTVSRYFFKLITGNMVKWLPILVCGVERFVFGPVSFQPFVGVGR